MSDSEAPNVFVLQDPHAKTIQNVSDVLDVRIKHGLTEAEAKRRLGIAGPNALRAAPRPGLLQMLLDQFRDFVVLLLIGAAIIAAIVGYVQGEGFADSIAIIAIVVLNAIMGIVQERRAENALHALKAMSAPDASVLRGGHHLTVTAGELVPGDVVILETGNFVPADVRLVETANLRIDEAPLTGESVAVGKDAELVLGSTTGLGDRKNMAYRGTVVTYGRGNGIVSATGMQTRIGEIADLIQTYDREPTPLQQRLDELGKLLGTITLFVCGIVFVVGSLQRTAVGTLFSDPGAYFGLYGDELLDLFMIAVSLAIAAVPEGLPAVVTIALAIGMQRMIRRHALIRRLPAVETLGSASTICSDKTGTLTQNEMLVVRAELEGRTIDVSGEGYSPTGTLRLDGDEIDPATDADLQLLAAGATLASDAIIEAGEDGGWRVIGDPTEGALVAFAARAGRQHDVLQRQAPRVAEIPFESERKRMTTIHRISDARLLPLQSLKSGGLIAFTKGAPDIVLGLCDTILLKGTVQPLSDELRQRIEDANKNMASRALRVLGVSYRLADEAEAKAPTADVFERGLTFIGLLGMIDPPRPEVADAIELARHAGVRTVMITGDYPATALAIAGEIGIVQEGETAVSGAEIQEMDDAQLQRAAKTTNVFARVSPEHKVRIVEALKEGGEIVAMTGDGVNDAPALKRAHIGVAMGITGTDVSRETADMVLTDDNFASIVAAIEEGRTIFTNIRKFVFYLLSCNVGEILIIFIGMLLGAAGLFGLPAEPALLPIHLLWLNLVSDGLPALALGLEKAEPGVMEQPPRNPGESVLTRALWPLIAVQATVDATATLGAFMWAYDGPETLAYAQTIAFTTLVTAELLRAFTSRSDIRSIFEIGVFSNRWMVLATLSSFALQLAVLYTPALRPVFSTIPLELVRDWLPILGFAILPAAAAEITKWIRRNTSDRNTLHRITSHHGVSHQPTTSARSPS